MAAAPPAGTDLGDLLEQHAKQGRPAAAPKPSAASPDLGSLLEAHAKQLRSAPPPPPSPSPAPPSGGVPVLPPVTAQTAPPVATPGPGSPPSSALQGPTGVVPAPARPVSALPPGLGAETPQGLRQSLALLGQDVVPPLRQAPPAVPRPAATAAPAPARAGVGELRRYEADQQRRFGGLQYPEEISGEHESTVGAFIDRMARSPVGRFLQQGMDFIPYSRFFRRTPEDDTAAAALRTGMMEAGTYPVLPDPPGKTPQERRTSIDQKNQVINILRSLGDAVDNQGRFHQPPTAAHLPSEIDNSLLSPAEAIRAARQLTPWQRRLMPIVRRQLQAEDRIRFAIGSPKLLNALFVDTPAMLAGVGAHGWAREAIQQRFGSVLEQPVLQALRGGTGRFVGSLAAQAGAEIGAGTAGGLAAGAAGGAGSGVLQGQDVPDVARSMVAGGLTGAKIGALFAGLGAVTGAGRSALMRTHTPEEAAAGAAAAEQWAAARGYPAEEVSGIRTRVNDFLRAPAALKPGLAQALAERLNFLEARNITPPPEDLARLATSPEAAGAVAVRPESGGPTLRGPDGSEISLRHRTVPELQQIAQAAAASGHPQVAARAQQWLDLHDQHRASQAAIPSEAFPDYQQAKVQAGHREMGAVRLLDSAGKRIRPEDPDLAEKLLQAADDAEADFRRRWHKAEVEDIQNPTPAPVSPPMAAAWDRMSPAERAKLQPKVAETLQVQSISNSLRAIDPNAPPIHRLADVPDKAARKGGKALEAYAGKLFGQAQEVMEQRHPAPQSAVPDVLSGGALPSSLAPARFNPQPGERPAASLQTSPESPAGSAQGVPIPAPAAWAGAQTAREAQRLGVSPEALGGTAAQPAGALAQAPAQPASELVRGTSAVTPGSPAHQPQSRDSFMPEVTVSDREGAASRIHYLDYSSAEQQAFQDAQQEMRRDPRVKELFERHEQEAAAQKTVLRSQEQQERAALQAKHEAENQELSRRYDAGDAPSQSEVRAVRERQAQELKDLDTKYAGMVNDLIGAQQAELLDLYADIYRERQGLPAQAPTAPVQPAAAQPAPAGPPGAETAQAAPPALVAPPPPSRAPAGPPAAPAAVPAARSTTGLAEAGSATAQGIVESLYDHLWGLVQRGETTEAGAPSTVLQVAKQIRDRGGLQSRDELQALAGRVVGLKDQFKGAELQRALRALVGEFSPAAPVQAAAAQTAPAVPLGAETAQAAPPAAPAGTPGKHPGAMTRTEFEETGTPLLHGTNQPFERFGGKVERRTGPGRGGQFFTDKPEVAERFAFEQGGEYITPETVRESLQRYGRTSRLPEIAPGIEQGLTLPRLKQIATRYLEEGRPVYRLDENGRTVPIRTAAELSDPDLESGILSYPKGREPRVITTKVYGHELDLRDTQRWPADLVQRLGDSQNMWDQRLWEVQSGKPGAPLHDYLAVANSPVLEQYAAEHGYGKVRVPDHPQSGGESVYVPDLRYVEHGQDPYAELTGKAKAAAAPPAAPAAPPERFAAPGAAREAQALGVRPEALQPQGPTPDPYAEAHTVPKSEFVQRHGQRGIFDVEQRPGALPPVAESGVPGIHLELSQRPGSVSERRVIVYRDEQGRNRGTLEFKEGEGRRAEIVGVYVDPALRGQGIASRMFDALGQAGYQEPPLREREMTPEGAALYHARAVRRAVAEGRPVPEEVLKDYPNLRPPEPAAVPAERPLAARRQTVFTAGDQKVQGHWAVHEISDLATSHTDALNENPEYPASLQPRDRTRLASREQIADLERKLDPALMGENALAQHGAPIVGPDGVVESGNARTIALRRAYASGSESAERYRQWLTEHAAAFGLTGSDLEGVKQPVLVRVRDTAMSPADRVNFTRAANARETAAMSATEQGKADADRITVPLLSLFHPGADGNLAAASNREFMRQFIGSLPTAEQASMRTADGSLSQEAIRRVQNAIFAHAYGDSGALSRLAESTDDPTKRITQGLLRSAGSIAEHESRIAHGTAYPVGIGKDVAAAAAKLADLRDQGKSVEDYLRQEEMFGGTLEPVQKEILRGLYENRGSSKKIAALLADYVDLALHAGDPQTGSMFAEIAPPTRAQLWDAAVKRVQGAENNEPSLFGTTTEPETAGPPAAPGTAGTATARGAGRPGAGGEPRPVRPPRAGRGTRPAPAAAAEPAPAPGGTAPTPAAGAETAGSVAEKPIPKGFRPGMYRPFASTAKPKPAPETFDHPAVEQWFQDSNGPVQPPEPESWIQKRLQQIRYKRPSLPTSAENEPLSVALDRLADLPARARMKAVLTMGDALKDLTPAEYGLFARYANWQNAAENATKDVPNPPALEALGPEVLADEGRTLQAKVAANPKVEIAYNQWRKGVDAVMSDYAASKRAIGEPEPEFTKEDWFHQEFLAPAMEAARINTWGGRPGQVKAVLHPDFTLRRRGGANFHTDPIQAHFQALVDAIAATEKNHVVALLQKPEGKGGYNAMPRFKAQQALGKDDEARQWFADLEGAGGNPVIVRETPESVGLLAASGMLPDEGSQKYQPVIEAIAQNWALNQMQASYGASLGTPAPPVPIDPAMTGALSDYARWIREIYTEPVGGGKAKAARIPEGYREYRITEGHPLYRRQAIPVVMAQQLIDRAVDELQVKRSDLMPILALGRQPDALLLKHGVAEAAENLRQGEPNPVEEDIQRAARGLKLLGVLNPEHTPTLLKEHLFGSIATAIQADPGIFREWLPAIADMAATRRLLPGTTGEKALPQGEYRQFLLAGGGRDFRTQLGTVGEDEAFNYLAKFAEDNRGAPEKVLAAAGKLVMAGRIPVNRIDESFRYAIFRRVGADIDAHGGLTKYLAARPDLADAVGKVLGRDALAYYVSDKTAGPYGDLPKYLQALRDKVPSAYWGFLYGKASSQYGIMANNIWRQPEIRRRVAQRLGQGMGPEGGFGSARVAALGAVRWLLPLTLMGGALALNNRLRFGKQEDEMGHQPPHLDLGRFPDGRMIVWERAGSLPGPASFVGLDDPLGLSKDILNGNLTMKEAWRQYSRDWRASLISLSAQAKIPLEGLTGRKLGGAPIRDRGEWLADRLHMGETYREFERWLGKPTPLLPGRERLAAAILGGRLVDPADEAYREASFNARDWINSEKEIPLEAKQDSQWTPLQASLYGLRKSIEYGDKESAGRFMVGIVKARLTQVMTAGVRAEMRGQAPRGEDLNQPVRESLAKMEPLSGMPDAQIPRYLKSLTPRQQVQLRSAYDFWRLLAAPAAERSRAADLGTFAREMRHSVTRGLAGRAPVSEWLREHPVAAARTKADILESAKASARATVGWQRGRAPGAPVIGR